MLVFASQCHSRRSLYWRFGFVATVVTVHSNGRLITSYSWGTGIELQIQRQFAEICRITYRKPKAEAGLLIHTKPPHIFRVLFF